MPVLHTAAYHRISTGWGLTWRMVGTVPGAASQSALSNRSHAACGIPQASMPTNASTSRPVSAWLVRSMPEEVLK